MAEASRAGAPPTGLQLFSSLRFRDFRLLWIGLSVALTGFWVQIVAQGWQVLELTDSPFLLGVVSAGFSLPMLVFSLPAGAIADRVDRRKLLLVTRGLLALLIGVQAILTISGNINEWTVLVISLVSGSVFAFDVPARLALVPFLVDEDHLMNAIALNQAVMNGTRILGPAVAGIMVSVIGIGGCYLFTSLSFAVLTVLIFIMKVPKVDPAAKQESLMHNIVEGLAYIRANWLIFTLILINSVVAVFGMNYFMLMPVFARDVLGVGASWLGILMAATGLGALLGSLIIAALGNFRGQGLAVIGGSFLFGITLILFALSTSLAGSLAFLALVGFTGTIVMTIANTVLQGNIPDELQGRVMSVLMLTWGLTPIGNVFAGGIAGSLGAPAAVIAGAVIGMVFTAALAFAKPGVLKI